MKIRHIWYISEKFLLLKTPTNSDLDLLYDWCGSSNEIYKIICENLAQNASLCIQVGSPVQHHVNNKSQCAFCLEEYSIENTVK